MVRHGATEIGLISRTGSTQAKLIEVNWVRRGAARLIKRALEKPLHVWQVAEVQICGRYAELKY